ncbi:MAG: M23 family metallopeptidase [Bacilli bacterium]
MKKIGPIIISVISFIFLFLLCFNYNKKDYPKEFYNVYLEGNLLGTITSKIELEQYINDKTQHLINIKDVVKTYCEIDENVQELINQNKDVTYYKNEQGKDCVDIKLTTGEEVKNIYTPNGLEIEKVLTYSGSLSSNSDIYSKIVALKSFTIKGYQFTIKDDDKTSFISVIDKSVFEKAVNELINTYVGKDNYHAYLNNNQLKIDTVGTLLENIYIQEEITVKEKQIAVDVPIYTDYKELANFLLFGNNPKTSTYTVKDKEMLEDIAFKNKISNEELLISNPKYKDINSLVSIGSAIQIKETQPQLKVVVENYVVEDHVNDFKTVYQYDSNQYIGYSKVVQEGEKGLERVSQRRKIINGVIVYVEPKGKEALKPAVERIVVKGDKYVPNVGDSGNWDWPTDSGWSISDPYGWRFNPITGIRQFHPALDIAGTGYNSAIFASNNGTIITKEYGGGYGNYIVIDHNNDYYTLYAHMNKFASNIKVGDTVARGQQIGYVGSTGQSTGPHLHFEVWYKCKRCDINPWKLFE